MVVAVAKESLIGQRIPKMDAPEKTAGKTCHVQDLNFPGQLYGRILRTNRVHARIKSIDASGARQLPGVEAVLTAMDVPSHGLGINKDNPPLKGGKVRCERDEIAAVAAHTPEIAEAALKMIKVEYEDLPA